MRRAVGISVGGGEIVHDLAFVPDVIAGGDHFNAKIKQVFGERRRDAESGGCVFAVRNNEVDRMIANQVLELIPHNCAARPSKNVADKKNTHANSMVSPESVGPGLRRVGVMM